MNTQIIDTTASIGESTTLGEFVVIGENVVIGKDCIVGHHVVIHDDTVLGDNIRIDDHTVIGKEPMRAANSAVTKDQRLPLCKIADDCIIGTGAIIYRGSDIGRRVLIADLATVRENVTIGEYTIIGRGVAVENFCTIGRYCKLETNVYITAYSKLADRVFVAPCTATSNDNFVGRTEERFKHFKGVTIETGARIGVNAVILPGKTIEADSLVAAGAVVTRDVPAQKIVAGMPARVVRRVPEEQLLENQDWPE
ncbi:MAG: N-acetyltransferase [FCB group bacterium]|nr:N-acetyltransferase [FCB group bacterium]